MSLDEFERELTRRLRTAVGELQEQTRDETFYAFALYTSGESDFSYVAASANTEEGLTRRAAEYAERNPDYEGLEGRRRLRWSAPDWAYHCFAKEVMEVDLPGRRSRTRDAKLYETFVAALTTLDDEGHFGESKEREQVTLLILCGDMSEEFFRRGLERLNPQATVDRYIDEFTPEAFFTEIDSIPEDERAKYLVDLYESLALQKETPDAQRARESNANRFQLKPRIAALGNLPVPHLLDVIERHGFGEAYYGEDSPEFEQHGAATLEMNLATSAAFLIADCGDVTSGQIERIQEFIARRCRLDADAEIASTLAENLARTLHLLRPDRFGETASDSATNRLLNAPDFLAG